MDLRALIEQMVRDGEFHRVLNNPLAQLGPPRRQYLGATLLPERPVQENAFIEEGIRYRTLIANSSTRYSPVQLKAGTLVGSFQVILGESDVGSQFTGADYDALLRILGRANQDQNLTMQAMLNLIQWADLTLTRPLLELNEKQRWDAIVDSEVLRSGDNGYEELVELVSPDGHRVDAGDDWDDDTHDPYEDIIKGAEKLAEKGFTVGRIIAGRKVISALGMNEKVRTRVGRISIIGGAVAGLRGRASIDDVNSLLSEDNLPPIEEYNLQYRTQGPKESASNYFLKRDVMVMVATTGRDATIDMADDEDVVLNDTLGYTALGRPAGSSQPERRSLVTPFDNKPPRVEGESWQTSFPVITEPEAVYVITKIFGDD